MHEKVAQLLASESGRSRLERDILPGYIRGCRWFRSKNRNLTGVVLEAWAPFPADSSTSWFTVLQVFYEAGDAERYTLPLSALPEGDAAGDPIFRAALLKISMEGSQAPLGDGALKGMPVSPPETGWRENFSSEMVEGEQSNTALVYSSGQFLKLYRLLQEGVNPESETLRFLERAGYAHVPAFLADLTWERPDHPPVTVAVVQKRIEAKENGWEYMLRELRAQTFPISRPLAEWTQLLGRRTAELHLALSSQPGDSVFAPEPLSLEDLAGVRVTTAPLLQEALSTMKGRNPEEVNTLRLVLLKLKELEDVFQRDGRIGLGKKIRGHGDLHLGQILCVDEDVCFIDFEGEPSRPLAEKRRKHSPLRDVAGMLRSFQYAAHVASAPTAPPVLNELFLNSYYDTLAGSHLLPQDPDIRDALLDFFVLEKAVYELHYELNNRPDWVEIPLRGLREIVRAGV